MAKARELIDHPLMRDVRSVLRPMLDRSGRRIQRNIRTTGSMRSKKPSNPKSSPERYGYSVFHRLTKVTDTFQLLGDAELMVRKQPTTRTPKKWSMTADRWLNYQYALFIIAAVAVEDRCLLLTNSILCMGLDPRDCKKQVFDRHGMVDARVQRALGFLAKAIGPLRKVRNTSVHEGESPDLREVIDWEDYDWLPVLALLDRANAMAIPQDPLARAFRFSGRQLAGHFRRTATRLRNAVWRVLDALHRPFLVGLGLLGGPWDACRLPTTPAHSSTVGTGQKGRIP